MIIGQLITVTDNAGHTVESYVYDGAGNILSATKDGTTHSYSYGDSEWTDLLTSYDGQAITYDAIGNPTGYLGNTLTWQNGRELATFTNSQYSISYCYDVNGLRTEKAVTQNGVTTSYQFFYNGTTLLQERIDNGTGTDTVLNFIYTADGKPYALEYSTNNGTSYTTCYYLTNLQGDVISILDSNGAAVVTYSYVSWGRITQTTGTLAATLGTDNPLCYRGYVYDEELSYYYLQSRYYDPNVGRFINADDTSNLGIDCTILGYNLYTYCGNNPVMGYNPNGEWNWGGVIAGLGIVAATAITVATFGVGSGLGAIVAAVAITTGATMTYAAATDSAMVIDASVSYQKKPGIYGKIGISLIVDFSEVGGIYSYNHYGFGYGKSSGLSYSTGLVENFKDPKDYAGDFIDVNASKTEGLDHCYNPRKKYGNTTKATSVSFAFDLKGELNCGVGYDYYSDPNILMRW